MGILEPPGNSRNFSCAGRGKIEKFAGTCVCVRVFACVRERARTSRRRRVWERLRMPVVCVRRQDRTALRDMHVSYLDRLGGHPERWLENHPEKCACRDGRRADIGDEGRKVDHKQRHKPEKDCLECGLKPRPFFVSLKHDTRIRKRRLHPNCRSCGHCAGHNDSVSSGATVSSGASES